MGNTRGGRSPENSGTAHLPKFMRAIAALTARSRFAETANHRAIGAIFSLAITALLENSDKAAQVTGASDHAKHGRVAISQSGRCLAIVLLQRFLQGKLGKKIALGKWLGVYFKPGLATERAGLRIAITASESLFSAILRIVEMRVRCANRHSAERRVAAGLDEKLEHVFGSGSVGHAVPFLLGFNSGD